MKSGKTANAIKIFSQHKNTGDKVGYFVPSIAKSKDGYHRSRDGLFVKPIYFEPTEDGILKMDLDKYDILIFDEAQFLDVECALHIRRIATEKPVYCYGLRFDANTQYFDATAYLLNCADQIRMLNKSICDNCHTQPGYANVFRNPENNKHTKNSPIHVVEPESDDYKILCYKCWKDSLIND